MWGTRSMLVAGLLGSLLAGCATVTVNETRVLTGQITDESGKPVAENPVLVVARRLDLATIRMEYDEQGRKEIQTRTDAQGRYRLEFVPASAGNNFFLFFYNATGFDRVKYRRPEPVDLTDRFRRDRTVVVNQVLQTQSTWPDVMRQIAYFGEDSDRGRILRRHGLPDKRDAPGGAGQGDAEVWWYYTDGVSYWFVGERLTRATQLSPSQQTAPRR